MKNLLLIFIVFFLIQFTGCKKADILPPLTTHGANTFGCKVNGKDFTVSGNQRTNLNSNGVTFIPKSVFGMVYIDASGDQILYNIEIKFHFFDTLGTYPIQGTYPFEAYFWDNTNGTIPTGSNQYKTDSTHDGSIKIVYYDGSVISGTFAFDAVNAAGNIVHITDGRFDIGQ